MSNRKFPRLPGGVLVGVVGAGEPGAGLCVIAGSAEMAGLVAEAGLRVLTDPALWGAISGDQRCRPGGSRHSPRSHG